MTENISYIIKSENEIDNKFPGYWHNQDGWCDYPDEATVFNSVVIKDFNLPIGKKVSWVVLSEEQTFIENWNKGETILRLVPFVGKNCVVTYCCGHCGSSFEMEQFILTREIIIQMINSDLLDKFEMCCKEWNQRFLNMGDIISFQFKKIFHEN